MDEINIKELRKKMHMTQEELAFRLGVSPRTISSWENGANIPSTSERTIRETLLPQIYAGGGDTQTNVNGQNIQGRNVTVHDAELIALLTEKERALQKSQEQIDKLLDIIDKLTNNQ